MSRAACVSDRAFGTALSVFQIHIDEEIVKAEVNKAAKPKSAGEKIRVSSGVQAKISS